MTQFKSYASVPHAPHVFVIATIICVIASWPSAAISYHSWRWMATESARMVGHVIENRQPTSVLSCLTACARRVGCWTVNHRAADGRCELNDADDRWNEGNLSKPSPGYSFYKKIVPRSPEDIDLEQLANASQCYDGHLYLGSTCLEVVPDPPVYTNWTQAHIFCNRKFGRLAVLDSPVLETILTKLPSFGNNKTYYIDISRRSDGVLVWSATGKNVSLARPPWYDGQPDNYKPSSNSPENCGNIEKTTKGYLYLDVPCDLARGYICQYAPWIHYVW